MLGKPDPPKTTYYRHAGGRGPKVGRWADVRPLAREAFSRAPNGMGCRQVAMALKAEQGPSIGGKTVLELMREEGPRCRIRRKRYDPCQGGQGKIAKNTLNRDFAAKDPTAKLVADVAEFKVAGAKAYLSPVMDLYNSEIVAWPVARSASFAQAMGMLDGLSDLLQGPPPPHSGQGWRHQQLACQRRSEEMGLAQSMPRRAACLDNACTEGFSGHLKDGFYGGRSSESLESLKEQIDAHIIYWNARRCQARLKGMTPAQYRGRSIRAA